MRAADWMTFLVVTGGCLSIGGCGATSQKAEPVEVADIDRTQAPNPSLDEGPENLTPQARGDATLTLFCRDFTGTNHAADAAQVKAFATKAAKAEGGSGDFYVVHGEGRSVLYHGFYRTDDPEVDQSEARRAAEDRQLIDNMTFVSSLDGPQKAFPRAILRPLETPDPVAPPEYDLRNSDAFWTIAIATYTDSTRGKQAAVDSVLDARRAGHEAYYLHKGNLSYVTIGAWPREAVREQKTSEEISDNFANMRTPPDLVVGSGKVADAIRKQRRQEGKRDVSIEVKLDIADPTLLQTIKNYDYAVDGYVEGPDPLLVNVPATLNREVAAPSQPLEAAPETKVDPLLTRPPGL